MVKVIRKRLVNPAGRASRRKLSAKQIKFFGTPSQKAALKRKRRKNAAGAPRRRTPARIAKPANRRRPARTNPGEIITFGLAGLANPAGRKRSNSKMAKTKKKAASRPRNRNRTEPKRRRRTNPAFAASHRTTRKRRRSNPPRSYRRRKNPEGVSGVGGIVVKAAWAGAGAVGTRLLTQLALGANNTGVLGYLANGAVAFGLGWGVSKFTKDQSAAQMVVIGGFVGILLRAIQDFTPFGTAVTSALSGMGGLGDIGVYGATTFFVPLQEQPGQPRGVPMLPGAMNQPQLPAAASGHGNGPRANRTAAAPPAGAPAPAGVGGRFSGGSSRF